MSSSGGGGLDLEHFSGLHEAGHVLRMCKLRDNECIGWEVKK